MATMSVAAKCSRLPDLLHAEQHDAEEARFEEERGQHFVGHQRADHRPGPVREHRPVRAELVGHHDARHHAHRERDRENLQPVLVQIEIERLAGLEPQRLEHREVTRESDRKGGEDEMKTDRETELDAREKQCVGVLKHARYFSADAACATFALNNRRARSAQPDVRCGCLVLFVPPTVSAGAIRAYCRHKQIDIRQQDT